MVTLYDCFSAEYSPAIIGDFQELCLAVRTAAVELDAHYLDQESGTSYTSSTLMGLGLPINLEACNFATRQYVLIRTEEERF